MSQTSSAPPGNKPGRYNRSFGGLIGSMIVLVLAVVGFVVFRGLVRADPAMDIEEFDYLLAVEAAQAGGVTVAYPPELPEGWRSTSAGFGGSDVREFSINLLDADDEYVGLKTVADRRGAVLERALGEGYAEEGTVEVAGRVPELTGAWDVYTLSDDTAIVRELPTSPAGDGSEETDSAEPTLVVVFGTYDTDELADVAATLTTAPLDDAS